MTNNTVLGAISARLGRSALDAETLEERFTALKQAGYCPVLPPLNNNSRAFFMEQARSNLFEITEYRTADDGVAALGCHHLPVVLSTQATIQSINWEPIKEKLTTDFYNPAIGIVEAVAAIAETGTLVIRSTDVSSAMLFLSDELVIVLQETLIFPFLEDIWQKFPPPSCRAIHLISGPSRTADVEQTLQVGAHGPRKVSLWVIGE